MDSEVVAQIIEDIHMDETSPDFYNNEQALRSVVKLAYLSAVDYYSKIDELPTDKGYADIIFWPQKTALCPALIVELKWNKSSENATNQIIDKNYDTKSKEHTCKSTRLK